MRMDMMWKACTIAYASREHYLASRSANVDRDGYSGALECGVGVCTYVLNGHDRSGRVSGKRWPVQ